jgi:3-oxoacyl-[acyl-carrier-protein] synthase-3
VTDGSGSDLLTLSAGGSRHPATEATIREGQHYIYMDGKEVFRFATKVMAQSTEEVLKAAGLTKEDVKVIIPHQANSRIIEAAARGLKLPLDRFVVNVDRYGNTSTVSIPIATLKHLKRDAFKQATKSSSSALARDSPGARWSPSGRGHYPRRARST